MVHFIDIPQYMLCTFFEQDSPTFKGCVIVVSDRAVGQPGAEADSGAEVAPVCLGPHPPRLLHAGGGNGKRPQPHISLHRR